MKGQNPQHLLIQASAGSGKTFQLTSRFLSRLKTGVSPDRILATTFTRKAAGEILTRVLTWLAKAAMDAECCRRLAQLLGDPPLTQQQWNALLVRIIKHLHRLQISTLDSFFIRLAGSFRHELGLPSGWRILEESEDARLRSESLQAALAAGRQPLIDLTRRLFYGETVKSVAGKMLSLIKEIYPVYLETDESAWRLPAPTPPPAEVIEKSLADLEALTPPNTREGTPSTPWRNSLEKNLTAARTGNWEAFVSNGIAEKILKGEETYARHPIGPNVRSVYGPLIELARSQALSQLAECTLSGRQLLDRFHQEYRRRKLGRKGLRFEDISFALSHAGISERLEVAGFRFDTRIDDLLLDEFQDTAPMQWRVLEPFAQRIIKSRSPEQTFFCVGDTKQAIYGWRGGVAELLVELRSRLDGLESIPLAKSYRSSPPVIETVNQVFRSIGNNAALAGNHQESARCWAAGFQEHSTHKTKLPGYVRLATTFAAGENEKPADAVIRYAAREIQRLAGETLGYSIGVLTRTNYAVALLVHELQKLGLDASEEGGVPLTDSPAVTALLSALKLADHPGDRAAWFHVAMSPLGPKLGIHWEEDAGEIETAALRIRSSLLDDGLGATLERWAALVRDDCSDRDWSRLQRLVEFGYRFEPRATLRPTDFIDDAVNRRVADPSAAHIRVMTIHQAKGLEFDIVVLPELERRLLGSPPAIVVDRPEACGPIRRVCRYASKSTHTLLPADLQAVFRADEDRRLREELCLLYVALTRAVHALHMIVAPAKESERTIPATFAGVLRAALASNVPAAAETCLYETGDPRWFAAPPPRPAPPEGRPTAPPQVVLSDAPARRRLLRQSPSAMEGGASVQLADRLRHEVSTAMDRGTLLHAWFARIEWLDDGEPSDADLRQVAEECRLGYLDLNELIGRFRKCLRRPALRAALLRPQAAGDVEVRREWPIAAIEGDAVVRGTLDRLVLCREKGKVVRAEILDYKTDQVAAGSPDLYKRTQYYRPQVEAYRRLTARQYGLASEAVAARLLFIEPAVVLQV